jgi:hypothetical protein
MHSIDSSIVRRDEFRQSGVTVAVKPSRESVGKAAIAKALALTTESIQEFEALYSAHYNQHQPQGELDSSLLHDIATAQWRIRQMQRAETEAINSYLAAANNAPGTVGKALQSAAVQAISREEDRCSKLMLRTSAALRKLKTDTNQAGKS